MLLLSFSLCQPSRTALAASIKEVLTLGPAYGSFSSGMSLIAGDDTAIKHYRFDLIHHLTQGDFTYSKHKQVMSTNSLKEGTETCAVMTRSLAQLQA